ncbi:hypothetical protein K469DRAFT_671308 [Zopfia rhizophila CBS 207.26]|uniref:Zn(2)-C6 fungal-type domain-containing protein n=1 Tax=Zopfia rhizophila CBS 207.26 TaxID=1314779 RepID=A0A6A6DV53_9PEZI|nr:hypothetical protein K469DRAFT_671308 [Zopfia rhizophila CBS 207.26]
MESRGENNDMRSKGRPAIARRSCDQCRSRKIGCDRGSPCSHCVAAKLECTFSAVVSHAAAPKQRVLISAQYEQKIDGIARDIDGIKALLQGISASSDNDHSKVDSLQRLSTTGLASPFNEQKSVSICDESQWDHSGHIIDFVKAVVNDRDSRYVEPEAGEVLLSLRNLVKALEDPTPIRNSYLPKAADSTMPPLEAVLAVLRWARDLGENVKTPWLPEILPRQHFTEICQKVYFSVDDYSEIDFILANGYLSYTFFEHAAISGREDYFEHCRLCRMNIESALSRLPLLLPATMNVIAALTLGVFQAIEGSETTKAWTYISTAANLCQTLGYHCPQFEKTSDETKRAAQERLFWTVYKLDKGLSFRLGRSSNIRDDEITLPIDLSDEPTMIARTQGRIYDQLYSPTGLFRPDDERGHIAQALATELRDLINESHDDVFTVAGQPRGTPSDQTRTIWLQSNLICQHSLLAQVLRAVPSSVSGGSLTSIPNDCIKVARDCLDMHEQCMRTIRDCKNDPFMMRRYINWAILHTPFVPFNILFTRAVQLLDITELGRLDRFAASLQPDPSSTESPTHPYRLYRLLCQAARLYFNWNAASSAADQALIQNLSQSSGVFDFAQYGMDTGATTGEGLIAGGNELSEWYYENQQIMNLLNDNVLY